MRLKINHRFEMSRDRSFNFDWLNNSNVIFIWMSVHNVLTSWMDRMNENRNTSTRHNKILVHYRAFIGLLQTRPRPWPID